MIVKGNAIAKMLSRPDPAVNAFLLHGRDEGRIREAAQALQLVLLGAADDPFRLVRLSGDDLRGDPARLADEAQALSMTGGNRVIRVQNISDAQASAFETLFDNTNATGHVIAQAGDLKKGSRLRKLFEAAQNAAAMAFYEDNAQSLEEVIERHLRDAHLRIAPDALAYLTSVLGEDRGVSRQELAKLVIFMGEQAPGSNAAIVRLSDAQCEIGDGSTVTLDEICDAAFSGHRDELAQELKRWNESGQNMIAPVRSATNHATRLQFLLAQLETGADADILLRRARPPIHFSRVATVRMQLRYWNAAKINQALQLLIEAEIHCKTTGYPDIAIAERVLFRIANAARA